MAQIRKQEALDYHEYGRKGKIQVVPTKPYSSQRDLSLAYSPGVAEPCKEIRDNKENVYRYTSKGNLVAVVSDGSAVLGLGDIGPEASKPVMEGKGVLFKIFADIDVFDIELDTSSIDDFINTVKAMGPTFGGVNLEDIKAPECFEIERRLKKEMDIPVMHDDQHGTAIITGAALLNALDLAEKKLEDLTIVVSGAGASAISCIELYRSLGAKVENIVVLDSKGVVHKDRDDLSDIKKPYATDRRIDSLEEAFEGADMFLGLSTGNIVSQDMIRSMASDPIVFALANPDPEITYQEATEAREDVIMATGRSDNPNQVNNVLGFPFIFRGALDVRARAINEEMKLAAVKAIADLAREPVPEEVNLAYNERNIIFGRQHIIPKPMDPRLLSYVSPAVARAAIGSGVARITIDDWDAYVKELNERLGMDNKLVRYISQKARKDPKRVVFAEADNYKVLKAAQVARDEGVAEPILLGDPEWIDDLIRKYELDLSGIAVVNPKSPEQKEKRAQYGEALYQKRQRKGYTKYEAQKAMRDRNHFGLMMVESGEADAFISGITRIYPNVIRPALQSIGTEEGVSRVAGMYIMSTDKGPLFFADTTINMDPTPEELVDITLLAAQKVRNLNIEPRIALLSYSNFGSARGKDADKAREAVAILHEEHPDLIVDGDVQVNVAMNKKMMQENYPFSKIADQKVNTLIFPNLSAGNIGYELMHSMTDEETIGPILLGLKRPVHILQLGSSVREIVNMVKIAVIEAQVKNGS